MKIKKETRDRTARLRRLRAHSLYDYWLADLASTADYYPGGMMMPGRNTEHDWSRMGAQGQQKDDEIYGKGNMYAYKYRMNNTWINRFFSTDPLHSKYPHNSDYAFSENSFIMGVELEGLELINAYYKYANDGTKTELKNPNDKQLADIIDKAIEATRQDDPPLYNFMNSLGPIEVMVGTLSQKSSTSYHMGHSDIDIKNNGTGVLTSNQAYDAEHRVKSFQDFMRDDPGADAWLEKYNANPPVDKGVLSGKITLDIQRIYDWNYDVRQGNIQEPATSHGQVLKHEYGHWLFAQQYGIEGGENAAESIEKSFDGNPKTGTDVNKPLEK